MYVATLLPYPATHPPNPPHPQPSTSPHLTLYLHFILPTHMVLAIIIVNHVSKIAQNQ